MAATCQATRKSGEPCRVAVVADSCYCFAHDPKLADKRSQARRRGGTNKSNHRRIARVLPDSLRPTIAALFTALEEVHAGDLEPKQGQAMAALAGAIARLYQAGILEERVSTLEAAMHRDGERGRVAG